MEALSHFSFGPWHLIMVIFLFIPTAIAFIKKRKNKFLILGLNFLVVPIFFLWDYGMLGWIVLLVFSLLKEKGDKELPLDTDNEVQP